MIPDHSHPSNSVFAQWELPVEGVGRLALESGAGVFALESGLDALVPESAFSSQTCLAASSPSLNENFHVKARASWRWNLAWTLPRSNQVLLPRACLEASPPSATLELINVADVEEVAFIEIGTGAVGAQIVTN